VKQNIKDHLISAAAGVTVAVFGFAVLAVLTLACVAAGFTTAVISAGVANIALLPAFFLAIGSGAFLLPPSPYYKQSGGHENYELKIGTAMLSGVPTFMAGLSLFFGGLKIGTNPDAVCFTSKDLTPVENTRGVSLLNHENAFNTPAQNGKKTLALTAKDFSRTPGVAQKKMAA
jgi:hypothetical protein